MSAVAQQESAPGTGKTGLKPYSTVYKTTARGLSIKLRRDLTIDAEGHCRLTSEGSLLVVGLSEVSRFSLTEGRVEPHSYIYQGTGLISRRREVHFTSGSSVIRSLYKDEWYALPDVGHTLDRMSQQEQMRLNLLSQDPAPEEMVFTVADGRKVKDYTLALIGEERLQTPMGEVDTLLYERQRDTDERLSQLWVAPDWDYLVVKTLHIEEGKTIEANLISAEIDGVPVTQYVAS
ncbi:DUF3108 domain-containing protein [Chromatocurvus halotolerans]|uniref:DUF3108 domain-containing protein n=1 Tax=Chromatocurvus halotolerans TaxID=1132028 RepID=UPI001F0C02D0|nr:DUF3108 domain-containing protein [Chromatocurvus halotolerans]